MIIMILLNVRSVPLQTMRRYKFQRAEILTSWAVAARK